MYRPIRVRILFYLPCTFTFLFPLFFQQEHGAGGFRFLVYVWASWVKPTNTNFVHTNTNFDRSIVFLLPVQTLYVDEC